MVVDNLKKVYSKAISIYLQALFPYTPASIKNKAIFIHIPKAAGTSVRIAIGESTKGRQHLPWWVYKQASSKRFDDYFKFAFVRDPLDRAYSGYKYLKSGGNQRNDVLIANYLKRYDCFNDFAFAELWTKSMLYHPLFRPQSWYLCDWDGAVRVDYVGKFENIQSDFKVVSDALHLTDFDRLEVTNRSKKDIEIISTETRMLILDLYRDDYNIFGY